MKELLMDGEGLNNQVEGVWIECGGDSFAMAIPLGHVPGGKEASDTIE